MPASVLKIFSTDDREIIECCDLEGQHQAEYARLKDLSVVEQNLVFSAPASG